MFFPQTTKKERRWKRRVDRRVFFFFVFGFILFFPRHPKRSPFGFGGKMSPLFIIHIFCARKRSIVVVHKSAQNTTALSLPLPLPLPLSLSLSLSLSGDDERRAPRRGTPILPIPRSLVERRQTPKPPIRRPRQSESVFGEVDVLVGKKSGCSRGRWHRDDRKLERRWGGCCCAGEV